MAEQLTPRVSEHRCAQRSQCLEGQGGCGSEQRVRRDCSLCFDSCRQAFLLAIRCLLHRPVPGPLVCSLILLKLFPCYQLATLHWAC